MTEKLLIVLLPGMDGTGDLFAPFVTVAPPPYDPLVVALPEASSYDELVAAIKPLLPIAEPFVLIAESFSGPLAFRLLGFFPEIRALVLVNSFVSAPTTRFLGILPWAAIFARPPAPWLVRHFLAGPSASPGLVSQIRSAISKTSGQLLALRLRSILNLKTQGHTSVRLLYLRGTLDKLISERAVCDTVLRFPNSLRVNIAAPHLLLQTAPAEAWAEIDAFLRTNTPNSTNRCSEPPTCRA